MAKIDIRDDAVSEIDTIRFSTDDVISRKECYGETFCIAADDAVLDGCVRPDVAYLHIKDIPNLIKALQKAQELWCVDNK